MSTGARGPREFVRAKPGIAAGAFAAAFVLLMVFAALGADPAPMVTIGLVLFAFYAWAFISAPGRRPHLERRPGDQQPVALDTTTPVFAEHASPVRPATRVEHHAPLTKVVQSTGVAFAVACLVAGVIGLADGSWFSVALFVVGAAIAYAVGWVMADTLVVDGDTLAWSAPFRRGSCPLADARIAKARLGRIGLGSPDALITVRGRRPVHVWRDRDLPAFLESMGIPYTGR